MIADKSTSYAAQRTEMIEYRVTFGWGQPNGPSPENNNGKYATVWAPTVSIASDMAVERYPKGWAHIYFPDQWANWSWVMDGCTELEVLQYDPDKRISVYPKRDSTHPDPVRGHGQRDGSKARSLYS